MLAILKKVLGRFRPIRKLARFALKNRVMSQDFYSGKIYFNALDYTFVWLNKQTCEQLDRDLQDKLLQLSKEHEYFVDIGANIGIMSLSVALRNPEIKVIAYDPNERILGFMEKSVKTSGLANRVTLKCAAVSNESGEATMDFSTGPYSGHLSQQGTTVKVYDFNEIQQELGAHRVLFKVDIEGFEKFLIPIIIKNRNPLHKFVIEIHPHNLNNVSDPEMVTGELMRANFILEDLNGARITNRDQITDWQNIICTTQ